MVYRLTFLTFKGSLFLPNVTLITFMNLLFSLQYLIRLCLNWIKNMFTKKSSCNRAFMICKFSQRSRTFKATHRCNFSFKAKIVSSHEGVFIFAYLIIFSLHLICQTWLCSFNLVSAQGKLSCNQLKTQHKTKYNKTTRQ